MSESSEPIELRPRATPDGRVDVASVRWTLEHMHGELDGNSDLARVRNALAIALMEIDRVQQQNAALTSTGKVWARNLPWPRKL